MSPLSRTRLLHSVKRRRPHGSIQPSRQTVQILPDGYRMEWGGEYGELLEAKSQLYIIGPLAVFLIFVILFALYGN
jgi:cobalt-zinc-cadmium resistance protein CzcA